MEQKIKIICSQCGFESDAELGDYCPICGKKFGKEDKAHEEEPQRVETGSEVVDGEPEVEVDGASARGRDVNFRNLPPVGIVMSGSRVASDLWNTDQPEEKPKKKILQKVIILIIFLCVIRAVAASISNGKEIGPENAVTAEENVIQEQNVQEETVQSVGVQSEPLQDENMQGESQSAYANTIVYPSAPSGDYVELTFSTASATSILAPESNEYHYEPSHAIDGDIITSWQEGAAGNGEGEELMVSFPRTERVKYLSLYTGNWRDQERFYNNCRPSSMRLYLGNYEFEVHLEDGMKNWYIVFPEAIETNSILFRIDSVYTGTISSDLCISEIFAYGEV